MKYFHLCLLLLTVCSACKMDSGFQGDGGSEITAAIPSSSESFHNNYKDAGKNIFDDNIHDIRIRISEGSWNKMKSEEHRNGCKANPNSKWWLIKEFKFDHIIFKNVGMKIRGNTSRCNDKLQFKIKFADSTGLFESDDGSSSSEVDLVSRSTDIENRRLFGLNSLSLRASQNDPSLAVEKISSEIFRHSYRSHPTTKIGALVYRVGFARVTISFCKEGAACAGSIKSVYQISENINQQFFEQRFGHSDSTYYGMSLGKATFRPGSYNPRYIEPKLYKGKKYRSEKECTQKHSSNEEKKKKCLKRNRKAAKKMGELISFLQAAQTEADLRKFLDLDSFLNYVAAATFVGHWDSAFANFNNDVIYYDHPSKKWSLVTWDLDNTFGSGYNSDQNQSANDFGKNTYKRNYAFSDGIVNEVKGSRSRPLFDKIFKIDSLNSELKKRIKNLYQIAYRNKVLEKRIRKIRDSIIWPAQHEFTNHGPFAEEKHFDNLIWYQGARTKSLKSELRF